MRSSKPIRLVEDDNVDTMTVRRAMKKDVNVPNDIVHQLDGEDALKYLRSSDSKRPCIGR